MDGLQFMIIAGINALNHDASITIFDNAHQKILFAGHSERYSRIKNDPHLCDGLISDALSYCDGQIDTIIWHENPYKRKLRYAKSGQWNKFFYGQTPKHYLKSIGLISRKNRVPLLYSNHHNAHAAGGFYTSGYDRAAIVVVDAIGGTDTTTVYDGKFSQMKPIFREKYPHSVGLFYSAITHLCGLKPNEEEYILMGMAAYGDPRKFKQKLLDELVHKPNPWVFKTKVNLHKGTSIFEKEELSEQDRYDLAAAAQEIVEDYLITLVAWAQIQTGHSNLVFSGGVALNCVANRLLAKYTGFKNIWIMPNPGDAGNSLGAILNYTRVPIEFSSPYLGYDIKRPFNSRECLKELLAGNIVGRANGRAEFGPRALGNRSLFADPSNPKSKDAMNDIKQRQKFRPFAPIILEEFVKNFFDTPVTTSPYMQFIAHCRNPRMFPGICHVDNTSRVQTINREQNPEVYNLLRDFYEITGCPMLMNTSLNIKGEPLVNTWEDAERFSRKYNVKIF